MLPARGDDSMSIDVRDRRLRADLQRVLELPRRTPFISVRPLNDVCDRYEVTYRCSGLVWLPGNSAPSITEEHRLEIYLHLDYPRLPPRLQWLTPIFHPNILSPEHNGGVCIGQWSPAETLEQLVERIGEMIQYRSFCTTDALDERAAEWAEQNRGILPLLCTPDPKDGSTFPSSGGALGVTP
jgi:ubiquitin-protein ligase